MEIDQIIRETTRDVINEIEEVEQISLSQEQRDAIRDLVQSGIGTALEFEETEDE
ncbi:MAG: hypothetical protein KJ077_20160 [Anaerolineae bacterium]|nr:hypothetical protein [Anaerolineae bacterium]